MSTFNDSPVHVRIRAWDANLEDVDPCRRGIFDNLQRLLHIRISGYEVANQQRFLQFFNLLPSL
ncbi:hypothetical protein D3C72_2206440 [compost metagenome]